MGKQDAFCSKRPNLKEAIQQALHADDMDSFMKRFWTAAESHLPAINRLRKRADTLTAQADEIAEDVMTLTLKINRIESDIHYCRYEKYHLEGYNVHEYLQLLKDKVFAKECDMNELRFKAMRIYEYIYNFTFH